MTHAATMLRQYPGEVAIDLEQLAKCIDLCEDCAQTCTACADADLRDEAVADLRKCIRTCLDCSDICETTAHVLSRQTAHDATLARSMLATCIQSCKSCADECERHAEHHGHCRVCAEVCRRCEEVCGETAAAM